MENNIQQNDTQYSEEQLIEYYQKTRSLYEENKKNIKLKSALNTLIKAILKKILPYEIEIEGIENIPQIPVIYANSHQDFFDVINSIYACPTKIITLNNEKISKILKKLLNINGVVYVDRLSKESKNRAKDELIENLTRGNSINLYPEGTWNCSPNKLHLPLFVGVIDIAKKTGAPIIPVAQEYVYDYDAKGKICVKKVYIKFGEPFKVNIEDNSIDKLNEFDEVLSTLQWELAEKNPILKRSDIDKKYYQDLVEKKHRDIEKAGSNKDIENSTIYGSFKEFYDYFPINEVDINKR